jgi:hypothetical protein
MTTSTTTLWSMTRDQIITKALSHIGVVPEGSTATATQIADAEDDLNAILAEFQTLGMPLWKREELGVTMVTGQIEYQIGPGKAIDVPFPLKVSQANLAITGSSTRLNMMVLAHYDYNNLPVSASGTPVQVTYQPRIDYGVLSVWPIPDASLPAGSQVFLTYQTPFYKFTSGTETLDCPQEWYNAIIYQLAHIKSDGYSLPLEDRRWFEKQAEKRLNTALSAGTEDTSIFFYPDRGDK